MPAWLGSRDGELEELARLREEAERFGTILEHAPVMIDAFDADGRCVLWNRECVRRLGYTLEEINALDEPLSAFYPDEEQLARVLADIARCDGEFREYRVRAKDGTIRDQLWANFRLPTGSIISVGHDVTERRAIEAQLRQAQKIETLGQLAGGIAHDFNNLLTVVLASTDLLEPRVGSDEAEIVAQVRDAAADGAELVRRLLMFSHHQRLAVAPLDLQEAIVSFVPTLRRVLPESIEICVDAVEGAHVVLADRVGIEQVLLNLATNARDAMKGRGTLTLGTRVARAHHRGDGEREYVVLSVRDTGEGMSAEVRDRVFEPFYTTKPAGRGTGLGLPMVYGLAEHHEGFVDLSSEEGRGTLVEVWLPLASSVPERAPSPSSTRLRRGNETVLVVEDDDATRETVRRALEVLGYRVLLARDGVEALEVLDREPAVDLVFSDVVMPRMTGPELLQRVRERGEAAPAVALSTGYVSGEDQEVIDSGVPTLDKPWSLADLASFVRAQLD